MRDVLVSILILVVGGVAVPVACSSGGGQPQDVQRGEDLSDDATAPDIAPGDGTEGHLLPDLGGDGPQEVAVDTAADTIQDALLDTLPDAGDAHPDAVDPPARYDPLYDFAGKVLMAELYEPDGKLMSSGIDVLFQSGALPPTSTLMHEESSCQFLIAAAEMKCDPVCDTYTQYCGPDKKCHDHPHRVSAGEVSIEGTVEPFSATPGDSAWYVVTPNPSGNLFEQGKMITVKAAGADISAFDVSLPGPGAMEVKWNQPLVLKNGSDNVVTWVPQGDGTTVELAILTGWHGSPPVATIWCTAPDSDGQIVIPQKMIEGYPPAGGIGLFQWLSFIRRVQREVVETPFGPVEVTASGEYWFSIEH